MLSVISKRIIIALLAATISTQAAAWPAWASFVPNMVQQACSSIGSAFKNNVGHLLAGLSGAALVAIPGFIFAKKYFNNQQTKLNAQLNEQKAALEAQHTALAEANTIIAQKNTNISQQVDKINILKNQVNEAGQHTQFAARRYAEEVHTQTQALHERLARQKVIYSAAKAGQERLLNNEIRLLNEKLAQLQKQRQLFDRALARASDCVSNLQKEQKKADVTDIEHSRKVELALLKNKSTLAELTLANERAQAQADLKLLTQQLHDAEAQIMVLKKREQCLLVEMQTLQDAVSTLHNEVGLHQGKQVELNTVREHLVQLTDKYALLEKDAQNLAAELDSVRPTQTLAVHAPLRPQTPANLADLNKQLDTNSSSSSPTSNIADNNPMNNSQCWLEELMGKDAATKMLASAPIAQNVQEIILHTEKTVPADELGEFIEISSTLNTAKGKEEAIYTISEELEQREILYHRAHAQIIRPQFSEESNNYEIILACIHGTWSKPNSFGVDPSKEPTQAIGRMAQILANKHHCPVHIITLCWSGELNIHVRNVAAGQMLQTLNKYTSEYIANHAGKELHLWTIAHSHGCNVVHNLSELLRTNDTGILKFITTGIQLASPIPDEALYKWIKEKPALNFNEVYYFYSTYDVTQALGSFEHNVSNTKWTDLVNVYKLGTILSNLYSTGFSYYMGRKNFEGCKTLSGSNVYNIRLQIRGEELNHVSIKAPAIFNALEIISSIKLHLPTCYDLDANGFIDSWHHTNQLRQPLIAIRKEIGSETSAMQAYSEAQKEAFINKYKRPIEDKAPKGVYIEQIRRELASRQRDNVSHGPQLPLDEQALVAFTQNR